MAGITAMPKGHQFQINFREISELAHTGVRRAVTFMGLGLNAMADEDFRDYQLRKLPPEAGQKGIPIDLLPTDLPAASIDKFKQQFRVWIVAGGIREIIEHYSLMLDKLVFAALITMKSQGILNGINPARKEAEFRRHAGMRKKLGMLKELFEIELPHGEVVNDFYRARNALTHGFGIVRGQDCGNQHQSLTLKWTTLDLFGVGKVSGKKQLFSEMVGQATTEETEIIAEVVNREKTFAKGERLELSQQDLWEICFFFSQYAIPSSVEPFIGFIRKCGVDVAD